MLTVLQLLLALFAVREVTGFVFSCEETKNRLVNSDLHLYNTTHACVVVQEGFNDYAQLRLLAVVSGLDVHYFNDIAGTSTHCVTKQATDMPWRVTGLEGLQRECPSAFTLMFSSADTDIYTPLEQAKEISWKDGMMTLVVPQTGIRIRTLGCTSKLGGGVIVRTGLGAGTAEEHYDLGSYAGWNCSTMPDYIVYFDNVITITADYTTYVDIEFSSDLKNYQYPARAGDYIAVYSSGKADDLQNLDGGIEHRANIQIDQSKQKHALVSVNMNLNFDPVNYGSIVLKESATGSDKKFYNGTHLELFNTDYFEIGYMPTGLQPRELGKSEDSMIIDIIIRKDVAAPTTVATPTKESPYCNCAVDAAGLPVGWKSTDIWLDIVIVMDTSDAFNSARLDDANYLVNSLISEDKTDFLTTDPAGSYYTRIGVISMADKPTVLYNLNMTKADKVAAKTTPGLKNINFKDAFTAATNMLKDGVASKPDRGNTRQVIYFMTDSDASTLLEQPFKTFRSTGIIIVNNFLHPNEAERPGLKKLASDGYYYSSLSNLNEHQSFCHANCFCKSDKITYESDDITSKADGGCYRFEKLNTQFFKSLTACASDGGILAVVHDHHKGEFLQNVVNNDGSSFSNYFWIGYEKSTSGVWRWEDGSTDPYTNWAPGEPSTSSVSNCAYVDRVLYPAKWGAGNCQIAFPYVCQYAPCSVGSMSC